MGLMELFTPEDKIELNFTQLHGLTTEAVKSEILMNGIRCNVPHKFLREVMTGKKEETLPFLKEQQEAGQQEAGQQTPEEESVPDVIK